MLERQASPMLGGARRATGTFCPVSPNSLDRSRNNSGCWPSREGAQGGQKRRGVCWHRRIIFERLWRGRRRL